MEGDAASPWRSGGALLCRSEELHSKVRELVPAALEHTGAASFDNHLVGLECVLRSWKVDEDTALAGLFHSIYGTEGFQGFSLPFDQRKKIRELIGARAERLAWLYCVVDRSTFDRAVLGGGALDKPTVSKPGDPLRLDLAARPELGAFKLENSEAEFLDLATIFLADYLEQVEGVASKPQPAYGWGKTDAWGYRRHAYASMAKIVVAERGLDVAQEMYDAVYAREPPEHRSELITLTPPITEASKTARLALASISL